MKKVRKIDKIPPKKAKKLNFPRFLITRPNPSQTAVQKLSPLR